MCKIQDKPRYRQMDKPRYRQLRQPFFSVKTECLQNQKKWYDYCKKVT